MYVNVARAAVLLCDLKTCRKASKSALEHLSPSTPSGERDTDGQKRTGGGKRAWGPEEVERERSQAVYCEHRRAELMAEISQIEGFEAQISSLLQTSRSSGLSNAAAVSAVLQNRVIPYFMRAQCFPALAEAPPASANKHIIFSETQDPQACADSKECPLSSAAKGKKRKRDKNGQEGPWKLPPAPESFGLSSLLSRAGLPPRVANPQGPDGFLSLNKAFLI